MSHLDILEAQLRSALLAIDTMREHLKTLHAHEAPAAMLEDPRPERCRGYSEERCGLASAEGVIRSFGSATAQCKGCRESVPVS